MIFFKQLHLFAGDILMTTILASILFLTFEEPFLLVENYVYKRTAAKKIKPLSSEA